LHIGHEARLGGLRKQRLPTGTMRPSAMRRYSPGLVVIPTRCVKGRGQVQQFSVLSPQSWPGAANEAGCSVRTTLRARNLAVLSAHRVRGRLARVCNVRDGHPSRSGGDAFRQADFPCAVISIDREEEDGGIRRMIEWSLEDEEIRAKLADREGLVIEDQVHFYVGGMPGPAVRGEDG